MKPRHPWSHRAERIHHHQLRHDPGHRRRCDASLGSAAIDTLVLNQGSSVDGNVRGGGEPADTITFNGGLMAPCGSSNIIRGNVIGFNTIIKNDNAGVAFIGAVADANTGLNATSNTIQVNGGGLYINADIAGSTNALSSIIANGAAIGGTGDWFANINVIRGGFSAGATPINLDANPANSVGTVGVQFNNNVGETGDYSATGSGANHLDSVFTRYFVSPYLTNAGTNLVLGVNNDCGGLPGLSRNESALDALALRAGTGTLGAVEQDLLAALSLSDLGAVQASLTALNPEASLALGASVVNSNYRVHRMVRDHLAMTRNRSEMETFILGTPTMDSKGGMIEGRPVRQTSSNRGNFWGAISYDQQDYEGTTAQSDFDGDVGALTAGIDFRVSPMFLLGGLIDGSKGDVDGGLRHGERAGHPRSVCRTGVSTGGYRRLQP